VQSGAAISAVVSAELAQPASVTISAAVTCPVRRLAARVLWPDWLRWAWIGRIAACEGPHRRHERAERSSCGALDRVYLALHDADVGIGPRQRRECSTRLTPGGTGVLTRTSCCG